MSLKFKIFTLIRKSIPLVESYMLDSYWIN